MNAHVLDTAPVVIGSKSNNDSKSNKDRKATNPTFGTGKGRNDFNHPDGKVSVYIDGVYIDYMPLRTLVRFSKTAAGEFRKPSIAAEGTTNTGVEAAEEEKAEAKGEKISVNELAAEVGKLNTTGNNKTSNVDDNAERHLELYNDNFWYQPPASAFKFVFEWMKVAKFARRDESPLDFGPADTTNLSLKLLVEYYAAALILGLRPEPHRHRYNVLGKITSSPPTAAIIQGLHEYLPIGDVVMTRAITCFFYNREKGKYAQADIAAIQDYVRHCDDPALQQRFRDIQAHRRENAEEQKRARQEQMLQQLAEGDQGVAEGHVQQADQVDSAPAQASVAAEAPGSEAKSEPRPSRRSGRNGGN